jgi:hypothetical protein
MKHYLLVVECCTPELIGPYRDARERDRDAKRRYRQDSEQDYYRVDAEGKISVEAFSGREMG